jgi:hypothetical protein
MKILIIAQNLFIARLLISLAEHHRFVETYKVVVFSSLEKLILERMHGVAKNKIISPIQVSGELPQKICNECIEEKRGTYSKKTIVKLQSSLIAMLDLQGEFTYQHIWVFNQHTFIGSFLKKHEEYAGKCIVFENSNKDGGVTILGDLHLNHGEALRAKFLDSRLFPKGIPRLRFTMIYRLITLILHARSAKGVMYYLRRFYTRSFNVAIFSLIRFLKKFIFRDSCSESAVLIALQIKEDSSIMMNIDFSNYCELLINKALEIRAKDPEISILIRPHPLDFTFGWLAFFLKIKRLFRNVKIDLKDIKDFDFSTIKYLITYNSNLTRYNKIQNGITKVYCLGGQPPLPKFSYEIPQFQIGAFK